MTGLIIVFHENVTLEIKEEEIMKKFNSVMPNKASASLQEILDHTVYNFLSENLLPPLTIVMTETAKRALLQAPPKEKLPLVRYSPPTLMRSAGPHGLLLQNIQRSIVPSRAAALWNDDDL